MRITPAQGRHLPYLPDIEQAADTLFESLGIDDLPPPGQVEELAAARAVLVSGDPPVGFIRIEEVDGRAHIEQLSVHPFFARQGIGTALLRAGLAWAGEAGYDETSVITFRDVAWNAPFYQRHGFRPLAQLTAGLTALRRREREQGLDALGTRVVLCRSVTGKV